MDAFDPMAARRPGKPEMPKAASLAPPSGGSSGGDIRAVDSEARDAVDRLIAVNNQNVETLERFVEIVAKLTERVEKLERWRAARAHLFWLVTGAAIGALLWRIFGG